jgi:hypothetical protein
MKLSKMTVTTAMILMTTAAAAWAAAPTTHGRDRALERLQQAASEHVRILTELSAQLPESAKADLSEAIDAANKGLQQAQLMAVPPADGAAAVRSKPDRTEKPETEAEGEEPPETPDGDSPGDKTTGLEHARERLVASLDHSTAVLTEVMTHVPPQAAEKIQAALTRIQENRQRALDNKDRVMASDHPQKPEHPERASRPERPQKPERAERPARPEHPRP